MSVRNLIISIFCPLFANSVFLEATRCLSKKETWKEFR